eukprot:TRINITY_DN2539_c0_g1_i2.p1 TRINITY_DN2539_c0_g1~~TRINITY_DN2539_c0_g1_i2.p1  ORF type:complete len:281 (-),score=50.04 TRINITY_DN2539_c0_g1_i2:331-1173(-)
MLNGILLVSSSSGALLFSKAYAPNFGFPPGDEGHMDVMSLAAMVHALQLNARALDHADDCSGLKMIETDDLQMQFHQEGSILCAVFSPRKLDAAVGRDLSELIAQRFAGVYGHLVVPGKPIAAKQFKKFRSELRAILGQLPGRIMERAFESLGAPGLAGLPYVCALTCDYAPTYSDESTEANLVHALRPGGDQPANASLQRASSSAVTGPPKACAVLALCDGCAGSIHIISPHSECRGRHQPARAPVGSVWLHDWGAGQPWRQPAEPGAAPCTRPAHRGQ